MMKKKIRYLLPLLLACLLCLQGCIHPEVDTTTQTTTPSNTTLQTPAEVEHYYETATYAYQTDVDETVLTTKLDSAYLVLANKTVVLGADYVPTSLTKIDSDFVIEWQEELGGLYLESRAVQALEEMLEEMKQEGVEDILVTSAYRDYAYQAKTFNAHVANEASGGFSEAAYACLTAQYIKTNYIDKGLTGLNTADAKKVALSYSAAPGTSEHQTGLCVDFTTLSLSGDLVTDFEETEAFAWLAQNAYKFGFILRYPNEKESITGYTYEPWHYRFVGREAATDIYYSGLTLEEYLGAIQS